MSAVTSKFAPPDSYVKLVVEFPLRPLRNDTEFKAAAAGMERLAVRGEDNLDAGERDYLDGLDEFISSYDRKVLVDRPIKGTPRARLQSLMRDTDTSPRDLERILRCSHSLISLVLGGKRELSKDNVRALARHYKLSADYFL